MYDRNMPLNSRRNVLRVIRRNYEKHGSGYRFSALVFALENIVCYGNVKGMTPGILWQYVADLTMGD